MLEEKLKRTFTILQEKFTESLLAKLGGGIRYEAIKRDQDIIGMLNLFNGVMFKFNGNKELTHVMWKSYASVF